MTTELEQEFYDTFGIEKIKDFNYCNGGIIEYYLKYPDITAEKLLQMIKILSEAFIGFPYEYDSFVITYPLIIDKNRIFRDLIYMSKSKKIFKDIKPKIQQLFKD